MAKAPAQTDALHRPSAPQGEASRARLDTEQRLAAAAALDALSTEQLLRLMNTQDMEVPLAVRKAIPAITAVVEDAAQRVERGGRLIYVGAGTSGRLGVLDASECPPTFHADPEQVVGIIAGGDKALRKAVEKAEDDPERGAGHLARLGPTEDDLVIGIAASGTTPFVWGALREARRFGAGTGLMTCVAMRSLMQRPRAAVVRPNDPTPAVQRPSLPVEVDHAIELRVGPEVLTGSTRLKAGTATKLALNMISTGLFVQLGKCWGNLMVDLRVSNAKLADRARRMLVEQLRITPDQADDLLADADGRVKTAIAMHKLGVDREEAELRIAAAHGRLRTLVGPPR
ncbi:MAG: N-acetylmuramic acid 6-phosphate etherase [Planctomycetota bacterium]